MTPDEQPQPVAWRWHFTVSGRRSEWTDINSPISRADPPPDWLIEYAYLHPPTSAASLDAVRVTEYRHWSDAECLDFLSIAFRHVEIVGTIHYDEIRQGLAWVARKHRESLNPPAESSARGDVSAPRPTDCQDIRNGTITVLARDAVTGEARMTMVKK